MSMIISASMRMTVSIIASQSVNISIQNKLERKTISREARKMIADCLLAKS